MLDVPKTLLLVLLITLAAAAVWTALDDRSRAARTARALWAAGSTRRWLLTLIAVAVFAVIADDAVVGPGDQVVRLLDDRARVALHGSDALRPAARAVSRATGAGLLPFVVVTALALAVGRRRLEAVTLAAGTLSAWAMGGLLKALFSVPRPRAHPPWDLFSSYGFPSGHVLVTLVACGLVAWAFTRRARGWVRALAVALAVLAALASGASRMMLDRHWLSDVIGGLTVGVAWLNLVVILAERRGAGAPAPDVARQQSAAPG